jgi:hypothetical protein
VGFRLDQLFDLDDRRTGLYASSNGISEYFNNSYLYDELARVTRVTQWGVDTAEKRVDFTYNKLDQFTTLTRWSDQAGAQKVGTTNYDYEPMGSFPYLSAAVAHSCFAV